MQSSSCTPSDMSREWMGMSEDYNKSMSGGLLVAKLACLHIVDRQFWDVDATNFFRLDCYSTGLLESHLRIIMLSV